MGGVFKKKWVKYGLIIIIAGAIGGYFLFQPKEEPEYVLATVERGNIVQTVTATGSIKADPTINLHFQKSGKVEDIFVEEGEKVSEGQILASLENRALDLEVRRNQANIDLTSAQYNQRKAGYTAEEIHIAEADVQSAESSLNAVESELRSTKAINKANIELAQLASDQAQDTVKAAERELKTTKEIAENELKKLDLSDSSSNTQTVALESAYTKARTTLDPVLTSVQETLFLGKGVIDDLGGNFLLPILASLKNGYLNPAEDDYDAAIALQKNITSISSNDDYDAAIAAALKAGNSALILLSQTGAVLRDTTFESSENEGTILQISTLTSKLSSATLSLSELQASILKIKTGSSQDIDTVRLSYQLQIDTAESAYNTAVNKLEKAAFDLEQSKINAANSNNNAQSQVAIRKAALDAAKANLALRKSPVRQTDLAPLLAQISIAKIALEIAQNEQSDNQLKSPMNGVVTFINGKIGENISISETALSSFLSIQADKLLVEANIPETDISKVKVGDTVIMTVDAFDFTEKFHGKIVFIDRAETVIQGVVYYQIKTAFELEDERLKSGMTTNLEITTNQKEDVLVIPARAINYEDSIRYVQLLKNGKPEKVIIETGLESDQNVEVLSGLEEGDKIITFVR